VGAVAINNQELIKLKNLARFIYYIMNIQVIGPTLQSGIGQLCSKYAQILGCPYKVLYEGEIKPCDNIFIFALPVDYWFQAIPQLKKICKKLVCMSICETETVHPAYGKLFDMFDEIAVASKFCQKVFSRQFPDKKFPLIHAAVPIRPLPPIDKTNKPYIFYHIGNIIDDRKQFRKILEAFIRMNNPDTHLLVKATCNVDVQVNVPRVTIINGLLPDSEIDKMHAEGDCYVSFSHSEGIGMGAVEAALHNKPVILSEYGAASEYIKSDYTIKCGMTTLPKDDFLFQKGMEWGDPDFEQLQQFMQDAYDKRLRYVDHNHTTELLSEENIKNEFRSVFL